MSKVMDFGLDSFDADYMAAESIDRTFKLPEGRYPFVIVDAELDTNRWGDVIFTLFLKVTEGDFKDACVCFENGFRDQNKLLFLKRALTTLGFPTLKPSDLQRMEVLQGFMGIEGEIEAYQTEGKGKNEGKIFDNMKILRVFPREKHEQSRPVKGSAKASAAQTQADLDEDLPF